MSTGLLLFLVFMALSILDSVARARRGQETAVPSPEEDGELPAEPAPEGAEGEGAGARKPQEALEELLGLEKLMGPAYVEKLVGSGIAGAIQGEDEDAPERAAPPASRGGEGERSVARAGGTPDQERRRAEARRPSSRIDPPPEGRGRPPDREEDRARPVRAAREVVPLADSSVERIRDRMVPAAAAPRSERRAQDRAGVYRDLLGGGDRDSIRQAFVLKEILDAPVSERADDRREGG